MRRWASPPCPRQGLSCSGTQFLLELWPGCSRLLRGRFKDDSEELEEDEDLGGGITGGRDESLLLRLKWGQPDSQKEEWPWLISLSQPRTSLCSICKGYFNNAITITKCLHTFCKNCTVRHFCYSNRCPKYNIVIHQTQPLYHIRLDQGVSNKMSRYKLVINLREKSKCMISIKGSRST